MSNRFSRCSLVVALGLAVAATAPMAPARAGDDGAAPIWVGIGSMFNLGGGQKEAPIEYQERGKLVLPPKIVLPTPGLNKAETSPDWPQNQEKIKAKKAAELDKVHKPMMQGRNVAPLINPGDNVVITQDATAGMGPGAAPCVNKDPKTGLCPTKPSVWNGSSMNPLTWVGLQKKDAVILGPEPEREDLTDPPAGLRAPVEGVGAKVDN